MAKVSGAEARKLAVEAEEWVRVYHGKEGRATRPHGAERKGGIPRQTPPELGFYWGGGQGAIRSASSAGGVVQPAYCEIAL